MTYCTCPGCAAPATTAAELGRLSDVSRKPICAACLAQRDARARRDGFADHQQARERTRTARGIQSRTDAEIEMRFGR